LQFQGTQNTLVIMRIMHTEHAGVQQYSFARDRCNSNCS